MSKLGIYIVTVYHPDLGTPDIGLVAARSEDEASDLFLEMYTTPELIDDDFGEFVIRGPYRIPKRRGILS
jgi:hypothetical protein